jgi:hypothetical protein
MFGINTDIVIYTSSHQIRTKKHLWFYLLLHSYPFRTLEIIEVRFS